MNKNKFFGILASSVLLLNASSPTLSVIAGSQLGEAVEDRSSDEVSYEASIEFTETEGLEESVDLVINVEADTLSFSGSAMQILSVEIHNSKTNSVLILDDANSSIDLSDNLNSQIVVKYDNSVFYESAIAEIIIPEETNVDSEVSLESEEDSEILEVLEEELESETNLKSQTSSQAESSDIEEDANTPASDYVVNSYIGEEAVSLPRASEIEDILHGENSATISTFGMSVMSTSNSRTHDNGIYTVRSGDTFSAIASSFGLSSRQLQEWNGHVGNTSNLAVGTRLAVTRRGVESMLSATDKARLYTGGATPVFSTTQGFIDEIAPRAIAISNQSGEQALYPSLMIAQAAHESNYGRSSLASPPYHNLSGIKGHHNGQSTLMWTWEVFGGVRVDVLAGFRKYPSYDASLQDYANLLRRGLSWDRAYYSGTWRSNTSSVWEVLDNGGLRGYATDPNYFAAIRRIINQFDLTKYDTGNFYVRTGTFLGETYTTQRMNQLKNANGSFSYRIEKDSNVQPYSYRRIETTNEFLGEAGAQRVINQIRNERGWSASMVPTGNSTQRHRVRSGFFNTLERAERALEEFTSSSGFSAIIELGTDGRYRIRTGFFNGYTSAQQGLAAMHALGWSAHIQESTDSTPHYIVRTGTFNTPNHVNSAETFFNQNGWGSSQKLESRNNYYYRIFIEDFIYEDQANEYVSFLRNNFNWSSRSIPVH